MKVLTSAQPGVVPQPAHAADVVVAFVHTREQLADLLGRVLQVGIERDHALAAAALEAGDDGEVLPEVAVQQHHARDVGALVELLAQQRRRAVAAAVVHEDHLVLEPERVEGRVEPGEESGQARFLVVDGNDDREIHLNGDSHHFRKTFLAASHTRSTSPSAIAGKSGSVASERPRRSACGNCPSCQPSRR
jgi:hypothetical protein